MAEAEIRPNIRIEISNNLADSMEVDEDDKTAGREEGEIWEESSTLPKEAPEIVPKFGNKVSTCVYYSWWGCIIFYHKILFILTRDVLKRN